MVSKNTMGMTTMVVDSYVPPSLKDVSDMEEEGFRLVTIIRFKVDQHHVWRSYYYDSEDNYDG